ETTQSEASTEPTSHGPTTDDPTTDEPTSGPCNGGPQVCEPELIESFGDLCGACGEMIRVCVDSGCGWSEPFCGNANTCALWKLSEGPGGLWKGYRAEDIEGSPPEGTIQVMFSLMYNQRLVVVTDSEYFVLDVAELEWIENGPRSDIFPEIGDSVLTSAFSLNEGALVDQEPDLAEYVFLTAEGHAWEYALESASLLGFLTSSGPCCDGNEIWEASLAPKPGALVAGWFDHYNLHDWYPVDLGGCNNTEEGTPMGAHVVYLAGDESVRLRDGTVCGEFVASVPVGEYEPFTRANAPDLATIAATSYLNGVYAMPATIPQP
ncbi:MAG: hypothetical protein ACPG4T_21000, partial [Nannocystaceae bacterium]